MNASHCLGPMITTSGPVPLAQAAGERIRDGQNGQILVLDIDAASRGADRPQVQRLDLVRLRLLAPARPRPRYTDADRSEPRFDAVRPAGEAVVLVWRPQRFAGRPLPALARQLIERPRWFALDHEHAVVERGARRPPDAATARLARAVLRAVPATGAEVDAAAERQATVDHHELLVMARGRRMTGIQDQIEAARPRYPELQLGQRLTVEAVEQRPVPDQHPDVQRRVLGEQLPEEPAQGRGIGRGVEADVAADVPADDMHGQPGAQQGAAQSIEIGGAVDQQGRPLGIGNAPAGDVLLEQRGAITRRRANVSTADVHAIRLARSLPSAPGPFI